MKRRTILNSIFIIMVALITFFGLGPVLFADGTDIERIYTLLVVIALYLLVGAGFYFINRRVRK